MTQDVLARLTRPLAEPASPLVATLRAFARDHSGARAVVEYAGRRGARVVLVGDDGTWSDVYADGTDVARQACAAAGVPVENGWEQALFAAEVDPDEDGTP